MTTSAVTRFARPSGRVPGVTGPDTDETAPDLPDGDQPDIPKKKKHALPFWVELPLLVLAAL